MSSGKAYQLLTKRNKGLIDDKLQQQIKKTRILLIGCGLGSQIAILAARTGFEKFILCDGDKVELHNLNRQDFDLKDLGKNKARVLKQKIKRINQNSKISLHPKFIASEKEIEALISKSDIIINMADPGKINYFIDSLAKKQRKPVFFPLNFVLGGFLLVFTPKSPSLEKIIGKTEEGQIFERLVMNSLKKLPSKFMKDKNFIKYAGLYGRIFRNGKDIPQTGISSNITSALVIKYILRWADKKPFPIAPQPILIDPWD